MNHIGSNTFNFRRNCISAVIALLYASTPLIAFAEEPVSEEQAQEAIPTRTMHEVVITATRTESDAADAPATITTISKDAIDRRMPYDEAALFQDEPGVAMSRDLRRFGATRINIRGIEDNRVTQLVDGVRSSDYYSGGGANNFTMSTPIGVPIEFLKRVEILRGSASSLYGSDAIGGVVGYITLDPSDLIQDDKNYGIRYRLGYNGINSGLTNTLMGAFRGDSAEFLIGYTKTDAHQAKNKGDVGGYSTSRSKPNHQDASSEGAIAKLILTPSQQHRINLTLEARDQEVDSEILRNAVSLPKVAATSGNDESRRVRGSVEWQYMPNEGAFFDRLTTRLYRQDVDTENSNVQIRTPTSATCSAAASAVGANTCRVEQEFEFSQESTGASAQFESGTQWGSTDHLLTYGIDLSRVETEQMRDGSVWNLTAGTFTKTLAGEAFPMRDFPRGKTDTVGLFLQDEISGWANGKLTIIPGIRYDWRRTKPELDEMSEKQLIASNKQAVKQTDSAFSPKLAAIWQFDSQWAAYGQIVRGFRAPNYEELNSSFRNNAQRYGSSPNPNLKAETSVGVELGLKLNSENLRGQFSVFDNHYKNFIENVRLTCPLDPNCITNLTSTYMYSNLSRVRIYGAEARAAWDFTPGWKLDGAVAWARGENKSESEPLDSVEPLRASLGLIRDAGTWGVETRVRGAASVSRTDDSGGDWYRPDSYVITDIAAWWQPMKSTVLNVAVNNLFDKKYWLWSDIRQADAINPLGVDFYTQPGRTVSASFTYQF